MLTAIATIAAAGAAPGSATPAWFFLAFPIFFVATWLLVATIVARFAGHMALLERYPPVQEREDESFRWASGKLRKVGFNNALHVGVGARGLHLAPNALFRPVVHRGVPCIPWTELRLVEPQPGGVAAWFKPSRFEIPAAGVTFALAGAAGRAVERRLASRGPTLEAPRRPMVRER